MAGLSQQFHALKRRVGQLQNPPVSVPGAAQKFVNGQPPQPAIQLRAILGNWLATEQAWGRHHLWLAPAMVLGISIYFSLPQEPALEVLLVLTVGALLAGSRRPGNARLVLNFLAAALLGASIVCFQASIIPTLKFNRPLTAPLSGVVTGWQRQADGTVRLTLAHLTTPRQAILPLLPHQIQIRLRTKTVPRLALGQRMHGWARLRPPSGPVSPHGYDFAKYEFFNDRGPRAIFFGAPKTLPGDAPPSLRQQIRQTIENGRSQLARHIQANLNGQGAALAIALTTGDRSALSPDTQQALRDAGLGHVLAISGLHMALVAGSIFVALRGLLAMFPSFSALLPTKAIALTGAWGVGLVYLSLSGFNVATVRAFLMLTFVWAALLLGRPVLTLHMLCLVAILTVTLWPEMVGHPGFQMSFAATMALIAYYEWRTEQPAQSESRKPGRFGFLSSTFQSSIIAISATAPFALFHFQAVAPLGLLANMIVLPIISLWALPAGLLYLFAWLLGAGPLVAPYWQLALDLTIDAASWISSYSQDWPRAASLSPGATIAATLGLCWICLLKSPLRLIGGFVYVTAMATSLLPVPHPLLRIAEDGKTIAMTNPNGQLTVAGARAGRFELRVWRQQHRASFGNVRKPDLAARCDRKGCILKTDRQEIIAQSLSPASLELDCHRADILIASYQVPTGCGEGILLIDRAKLLQTGAIELWRNEDGTLRLVPAVASTHRPWTRWRQPGNPR